MDGELSEDMESFSFATFRLSLSKPSTGIENTTMFSPLYRFIQWTMNSHKETRGTRKSSYNTMFFEEARLGIQHTSLSREAVVEVINEDQLVVLIEENKQSIQLFNNSYKKEKMMQAVIEKMTVQQNDDDASAEALDEGTDSGGNTTAGSGSEDMASSSDDSNSSKRIDFVTHGSNLPSSATIPSNPVQNCADQGNKPSPRYLTPIAPNEDAEQKHSMNTNAGQVPSPSNSNEDNGDCTASSVCSQDSSSTSEEKEERDERDRFADSSGSGSDDSNYACSSMHSNNAQPFHRKKHVMPNQESLSCSTPGDKQAVRIKYSNCNGKVGPSEEDLTFTAKRIKKMEEENEELLDIGTGKRKKLDKRAKRRLNAKWNKSAVPSQQIYIHDCEECVPTYPNMRKCECAEKKDCCFDRARTHHV